MSASVRWMPASLREEKPKAVSTAPGGGKPTLQGGTDCLQGQLPEAGLDVRDWPRLQFKGRPQSETGG